MCGNGIDGFLKIIGLLNHARCRSGFRIERLSEDVVLKRSSSQCGSKCELFFSGKIICLDCHRNAEIPDDIQFDAVNGSRGNKLVGDFEVPRNADHGGYTGDGNAQISRRDLIEAVHLVEIGESETVKRFAENRIPTVGG